MMKHFEDETQLYALGMLSSEEATVVELHAADCEPCRDALTGACEVVAALSEYTVRERPAALPRRPDFRGFAAGILAGAAVAVLLLLPSSLKERMQSQRTDVALTHIVTSHFNHVPFAGIGGSAVEGKVLYARQGGWIFVLVHHAPPQARVELQVAGAGPQDAGALITQGDNATLWLSYPGKRSVDVLLENAGKLTARAAVRFPK